MSQETKELKIIKGLFERSKNVWVIHYACSDFNARPIRIASISLRKLTNNQIKSFSLTNQENDESKEKEILKDFFNHIKSNPLAKYLHWNMYSDGYGFSAIEARFNKLFNEKLPFSIPDDKKYDLSDILTKIYGEDYINHDRLKNLMTKNNLLNSNGFLSGLDEALAFDNG